MGRAHEAGLGTGLDSQEQLLRAAFPRAVADQQGDPVLSLHRGRVAHAEVGGPRASELLSAPRLGEGKGHIEEAGRPHLVAVGPGDDAIHEDLLGVEGVVIVGGDFRYELYGLVGPCTLAAGRRCAMPWRTEGHAQDLQGTVVGQVHAHEGLPTGRLGGRGHVRRRGCLEAEAEPDGLAGREEPTAAGAHELEAGDVPGAVVLKPEPEVPGQQTESFAIRSDEGDPVHGARPEKGVGLGIQVCRTEPLDEGVGRCRHIAGAARVLIRRHEPADEDRLRQDVGEGGDLPLDGHCPRLTPDLLAQAPRCPGLAQGHFEGESIVGSGGARRRGIGVALVAVVALPPGPDDGDPEVAEVRSAAHEDLIDLSTRAQPHVELGEAGRRQDEEGYGSDGDGPGRHRAHRCHVPSG